MSIQKTFNKIHTINFKTIKILENSLLPPNISLKIPNLIHSHKILIIRVLNICKNKKTKWVMKKTTMIINKQKLNRIIM